MKQIFTFSLIFLSFQGFTQDEPEWFEVGTTWTFNHLMAFDPNQDEYLAEFEVTEILEHNGHLASKIEATAGGLFCLSVQPPYYLYESNDSVFYSSESMDDFELAYIFGESESWTFPVISDFPYAEDYLVTVMNSEVENVGGVDLEVLTLEYENLGAGINEIYPTNIQVIEFIGALNFFVVPFGNVGVCDGEYNIQLRCFSSPSFDYQNPLFSSCTLGLDEAKESFQTVYPNPATGTVFWNEPIDQLTIYDSSGKLVLQRQMVNSERSLSVDELPRGFYTVLFHVDDNRFSQKLILR